MPIHRSDSKHECSFGCEEGDACIWAVMIVSLLQTSAATSRDGTRVWVPRVGLDHPNAILLDSTATASVGETSGRFLFLSPSPRAQLPIF